MTLQRFLQEAQSSRFVPRFGDEGLEDFTLVIDRAPQVVRLAVDLYVDLINMPYVDGPFLTRCAREV